MSIEIRILYSTNAHSRCLLAGGLYAEYNIIIGNSVDHMKRLTAGGYMCDLPCYPMTGRLP